MSEWAMVPLHQLARWLSGGTPRTSVAEYWCGEIPWISAASLQTFYIRASHRNVTQLGAENGTRVVPPGTTIFVVRGMSLVSEFRVGVTKVEVAFGQDCKALVPYGGVDPYFLAYAVKAQTPTILDLVESAGHGTGRLPTDRIINLCVPVPSKENEQRKTVGVLRALDDKIAVNDRIVGDAEQLMVLLGRGSGGESVVPLSELAEALRDQVVPSNLGATTVAHYSIPSFDSGRVPEQVSPTEIKSGKLRVSESSLLLSKLNPRTPRAWLVEPPPYPPAVASTEFLVLKPKHGVAASAVWSTCSQPHFWEALLGKTTGTSNSHQRVKPADLLATEVTDPRALTSSARSQIESLSKRVAAARAESQRLAALRDALLPRLMSGEMRVRDAERAVEEAT